MLIDTSVFIAAERGHLDLDAVLAAHGHESVALAAITASELLHIAATALGLGVRVATRDARSFPLIPGLALVRW